jgi:transposase
VSRLLNSSGVSIITKCPVLGICNDSQFGRTSLEPISKSINGSCERKIARVIKLTDEQWGLIREHFPEESYPADRSGRKPTPARKVLEAALWILNTGAQWHMLPQCYPSYKTVHRRFQQWCQNEVLREALTALTNQLRESSQIDEFECFIDATFASAKGG